MNETEPLNMVKALLIQRAKGEMELVPSAVGPDEMEQRCRISVVRSLEGWSPEAGNAPLGAVIDKRAAPEPSCPPAA